MERNLCLRNSTLKKAELSKAISVSVSVSVRVDSEQTYPVEYRYLSLSVSEISGDLVLGFCREVSIGSDLGVGLCREYLKR